MQERKSVEQYADGLTDVVEHAKRLQQQAEESITALKVSVNGLRSALQTLQANAQEAARSVPSVVETAVRAQLPRAANEAADLMLDRLEKANRSAERAACAYSASLKKLVTCVSVVFTVGVCIGAALAWGLLR